MHPFDWLEQWVAETGSEAGGLARRIPAICASLPEPDRAADDARRVIGALGSSRAVGFLARHRDMLEHALRLGGVSRYAFDALLRWPDEFAGVVEGNEHHQLWGRRSLSEDLAARMRMAESADARARVRIGFKDHHYMRISLGDVTGGMRFESIVSEISDLVDVLVEDVLLEARQSLQRKWPSSPVRFVVYGMGKLGGRELNYSSDIDLIFLYEDADPASGWECHEYCQRVGAETIRLLDEPSAWGRLFRVDMRLRPEGDRGAIALSLRETIDYYYSVGRPWERQAMIKARPIAGDLECGWRMLTELEPWIYPKDPHWEDLDNTRGMRRRIEERKATDNLKTGAGGIRDIEFLVQFFQLSHGGNLPELRGRSTLPMLRILADTGLLPKDSVRDLENHYRFLRIIEHRLQMWEDRQIHDLPIDRTERISLARRCGFTGPNALTDFDARVAGIRGRVRALADRHYLRATRYEDALVALLSSDEVDDALIDAVLEGTAYRDRRSAARYLRSMAADPFFLLSRSRTERSLAGLIPSLLPLIDQSPDPDQTIANLARIAMAVGGRSTFFDLLASNPKVLKVMVDLAGWATYLVNLLGEVPGLPDELVDTLNQPRRGAEVLAIEARGLIKGISDLGPPLRFFQARETLAAAVRDLEGSELAAVNRHLSNVAVAVVAAVLDRCISERGHVWGFPTIQGRPCRFAIIGLGKLGSRALSYASDMDVIFVCDAGGHCRKTDRDGEEFWTRIAKDVIRICDDAKLYEIDPRLRPWGEQGPMVASLESLRTYWSEPRDLWERMAMLRMAWIGGDPTLGAEIVAMVRTHALTDPLPGDAPNQVVDMRRRLEESVAGRDHVKRGWGGYVDHEFIAQYRSFGLDPKDLPMGAPISETLLRLGALGRIPSEAATQLSRGLIWLRFVESRMRLTAGRAVSSIPTDMASRLALARRCGKEDVASFDLEMHDARQNARRWFEALIR